jgi:hypothetical protein
MADSRSHFQVIGWLTFVLLILLFVVAQLFWIGFIYVENSEWIFIRCIPLPEEVLELIQRLFGIAPVMIQKGREYCSATSPRSQRGESNP